MLPKKVKKRASLLAIFLLASVLGVFLILNTLNKNILEINNQEIKFIITDFKNEISVSFKGTIPNLFAEGKGVVAEGMLKDKRFFEADRILAKHDENYMPPELKNILSDNAK